MGNINIILLSLLRKAIGIYTFLIFIKVITSWFPELNKYKIIQWIAKLVDPYLNLIRRLVPPLGGMIDLSPILAFFSLQFLEWILNKILL